MQRVHVFPSEIAATQHRITEARRSKTAVVDSRRWISWDQFKQYCVVMEGVSSEAAPANAAVRTLCADELLRRGIFSVLLPPGAQGAVFRRFAAGLLPSALRLEGHAELDTALGTELAAEIRLAAQEYRRFLDRVGMYDPSAVQGRIDTRGSEYELHFPELMEDFPELESQLRAADGVYIAAAGTELSSLPELRWFATVKGEVRSLMDRIGALLAQGTPWRDICISAADLETVLPHLQREARIRGIPLNPRQGTPLSETPGAAVFSGLSRLAGEGMRYQAVRDFVLHRRIPFKKPEAMHALAAIGRRYRCWGRLGGVDLWERGLSRAATDEGFAGQAEAASGAYRDLARTAAALQAAKGMREVRTRFFEWYTTWIQADAWDEDGERELQSCLELMGSLIELEDRLGLTASFAVFLELLGEKLYLQAGGSGIPVYPYRVAAGGMVAHHFVVNLHQDASEVLSGGIAFLRDDQQELLGVSARDMTEAFLRGYAVSGAEVRMSGNAGIRGLVHGIPAVYLQGHAKVSEVSAEEGIEAREQAWWGDPGDSAIPQLPEVLAAGAERFRARLTGKPGLDFTRQGFGSTSDNPVSQAAAARVQAELARRYCQDDYWKVSAASLRAMTANPAAVFLERILGLDEDDWEPSWQMVMEVGNIYHTALEWLFDPGGDYAGADWHDPQARETALQGILERLRTRYIPYRTRLTPLEAGFELATLRRTLLDLLPILEPGREGAVVEAVEYDLLLPDPDIGVLWNARIDRLDRIQADGTVILYDYKRSRVPEPRDLRPEQLDDSDPFPIISEPQMAVYLRCSQLAGEEVAGARYVGLLLNERSLARKVRHVVLQEDLRQEARDFGGYIPRNMESYNEDDTPQLFAALLQQCQDYRRRLDNLDFSLQKGRTRHQDSPAFRQVTRHRYRVR